MRCFSIAILEVNSLRIFLISFSLLIKASLRSLLSSSTEYGWIKDVCPVAEWLSIIPLTLFLYEDITGSVALSALYIILLSLR